ncbi:hypothetical protein AHMF7616_03232 [Adhaeribacter pallidiroseus]|uniref:Uncharacterized protein n=1 Tax=Adhaeribacter pallidiroseus TaxID=2072847 RepID=A0A369QN00_9BACT|nr:hypothetical protein AHMF7616_03232 [Adhaeribacter pallidiroseus]
MGRLKPAILKQIKQREPSKNPRFIIEKGGDLVRHIPQDPSLRGSLTKSNTYKPESNGLD